MRLATCEELINTFNAQNPGIVVQFVSLDEAYRVGARFSVGRTDTVGVVSAAEPAVHDGLYDAAAGTGRA